MLMNSAKMNDANIVSEMWFYEWCFQWMVSGWVVLSTSFGGTNFIAHINSITPSLVADTSTLSH